MKFRIPLFFGSLDITIKFSNRKKIKLIEKIKQTPDDLNNHFKRQICLLSSSCEAFNKGLFYEEKNIANILQVLLHSKKGTKSLIKQLSFLKNSPFKDMQFVSTANEVHENNDLFHWGF